jgi:cell division protein FtsI/penicillin-binding protein 2
MRRAVILAGGAVLAVGVVVIATGHGSASSNEAANEAVAYGNLADQTPLPAPKPPKPPPPPPPPVLDLDHVERVGDHFEAPLADGRRAVLTLDPDLQDAAIQLLDQARAPRSAIVALAPDGRVLALAGRRTAEPEGGTKGNADWHLALDVWAPAASIFKLVTASALVAGGVDPTDTVCYHGGLRSVTESNLKDDPKRDHVCSSLSFGVAHSNNAILGKLAYQKLTPDALDRFAHDLGFGGDLPASFGVRAHLGDATIPTQKDLAFAQTAAGFSNSRLSVLGGALLAATFADGGDRPTPRIIASIVGATKAPNLEPAHRALNAEVARAVGRMMVATCEIGSAARSFRRTKAPVAGKTGTLAMTEPFAMETSWFVGYAPADKPEIIVSVLLGNPENWHLRGHEAAKKLLEIAGKHGARNSEASAGSAAKRDKRANNR